MESNQPAQDSFRSALLTWNNPTQSPDEVIETAKRRKSLVYCAVALEEAPTSMKHLHIYLTFKNSVRRPTLEKLFPGAYIEAAKGNPQQNLDYIKKTGKWAGSEKAKTSIPETFREWGTLPQSAQKPKEETLSGRIVRMVEEGHSNRDILRKEPGFLTRQRDIDSYRHTMMRDKSRKRKDKLWVEYIFGPAGSGKTQYVMSQHKPCDVYVVTDYRNPYDGYQGEPVILFDMFHDLPPDFSLADVVRILNPYATQLPARGQNLWACFERVYFTSYFAPGASFKSGPILESFFKRISNVAEMKDGERIDYGPYADFARAQTAPASKVIPLSAEEHRKIA